MFSVIALILDIPQVVFFAWITFMFGFLSWKSGKQSPLPLSHPTHLTASPRAAAICSDKKIIKDRATETAEFPHCLDCIAFIIYSDNKEAAYGAESTETGRQRGGGTGESWGQTKWIKSFYSVFWVVFQAWMSWMMSEVFKALKDT